MCVNKYANFKHEYFNMQIAQNTKTCDTGHYSIRLLSNHNIDFVDETIANGTVFFMNLPYLCMYVFNLFHGSDRGCDVDESFRVNNVQHRWG